MGEIRSWLDGLGLEKYADTFEENEIDLEAAKYLTEDVLERLLIPIGPRLKLIAAIAALDGAPPNIAAVSSPKPGETQSRVRDAERRQITVMFCDLVGSTALSEKLDPEDLRDVMRAYQDACAKVIGHYEGHVAQTLGDGLMVYFGYPAAHEDDAHRAVRAGLDILGAVAELSAHLETERGVLIDVRIGIHTGLVVAGEVGGADTRGDMAVVGETPNIAARIESLAEPGAVVVGGRTRRLVGDVFDFEDLGSYDLKGLSVPMNLFRAKSERKADSRFNAMHTEGLTPFVGREEEIGLLLGRWNLAKSGEGQAVLLEGEPGIGKSRITDTLRELIRQEAHTRLQYQCSPFYVNSAFHPIISQLERAAGFESSDGDEEKLEKLTGAIATGEETDLVLIANLLSLPVTRFPALNLSPQKQKERTIEVLIEQVAKLAKEEPILLVFEDVHWIDPTSLEALDQFIAAISSRPVLGVITFRPEFEPRWGAHSHVTAVSLNRLGNRQSRSLVEQVSIKPLPDVLIEQVIKKTDGVPLFIEELTKAVIDSNLVTDRGDRYQLTGAVSSLAIPDTLHDSLMARLDKLIPVKEVAQLGAAIGREFSHQLVALLSPKSEFELNDALEKLVASELVFRRGTPPEATYTFKHALVQDAAYDSMLKRDRRTLHKQIAEALQKNFGSIAETEPELLAHHYTEANLPGAAIPFWQRAGNASLDNLALSEAVSHFSTALRLMATLPDAERDVPAELAIRIALSTAYMTMLGWCATEVVDTLAPARELCQSIESTDELVLVFYFVWMHHWTRSEYQKAHETIDELDNTDPNALESTIQLAINLFKSLTYGQAGVLDKSEPHAVNFLQQYREDKHSQLVNIFGHDPKCLLYSNRVHQTWASGFPDRALSDCLEQIDFSRRLAHPFNLVFSLASSSVVHYLCGRFDTGLALAREAQDISREQALSFMERLAGGWRHLGEYYCCRATDREVELRAFEFGVQVWRDVGGQNWIPVIDNFDSSALMDLGHLDEAIFRISEAIDLAESKGHKIYYSESLRLEGVSNALQGRDSEQNFKGAIEAAKSQGTKSWELRAATSLARLLQSRGETMQARDILAPTYDWFTEGFETVDLREAKALLKQLS